MNHIKRFIAFLLAVLSIITVLPFSAVAKVAAAPVLKETTCYSEKGKICCTVVFQTVKGEKYRVYRRDDGSSHYTKLGDIRATGGQYSFRDTTVKKGKVYYYTVRKFLTAKTLSEYHKTGIKGLCFDTAPQITLTTLSAFIRFRTTPHASSYTLFRKTYGTAWRAVKTVPASTQSTLTVEDVFRNTVNTADEKKYLLNNTYIDPSENPFYYEVRANYANSGMVSRGYYAKEGECVIAAPSLCELKKSGNTVNMVWSGVPVAESYNIYAKTFKNGGWTKLKSVGHADNKLQRATLSVSKKYNYYTVRAFTRRRGILTGGAYETGFTTLHRKYGAKKALFVGDSFAIGRPYNGERLRYYTYAKRVEQLLGMRCDNIAITASTYASRYELTGKQSVWSDQVQPVSVGKPPHTPAGFDKPTGLSPLWQYDYVIIEGGLNDHAFNTPLGEANTTDITTLNGALNQIKAALHTADKYRTAHGLPPVKVIVLSIAYSARGGSKFYITGNRMQLPNALGITMQAYVNEIMKNLNDGSFDMQTVPSTVVLNEKNCLYESADNLHYTKLGYAKLGNVIASMILKME